MDLLAFLPADKAEHALGGAAIGAATVAMVQRVDADPTWWGRVGWGTAAGLVAGLAKEGLDASRGDWRDADWRDAAATTVGAFVGAMATATASDALEVVVTPRRDGGDVRVSWRF